ncbi:HET-domain-containing protein [Pilatotrama ljubarskyi]|nr:HET-domain-containing protein [Pilatotrama ljubarskyi]
MDEILFLRLDLPPKPRSLCQSCWEGPVAEQYGLFLGDFAELEPWNWTEGYSYITSWAAVQAGTDASCVWCELVSTACKDDDDPQSTEPIEIRVGNGGPLVNHSPVGTQALYVCMDDEPHFGGYVYTGADDPAAPYIVGRSPIPDLASPHALSLAKMLVETCVREHKNCIALSPIVPHPLLPTRLVDCTDPDRPRLTTTDGEHGSYLALSYVWGEAQPHRTVKANVSAYAKGIACLPQTIRDAIRVTHELGFQYLWTDSLCIIQDSDEDKQRELGRMHSIYRDAYLTIIAASAHRVGEGFLQPRPTARNTGSVVFPHDITLPFLCPPRGPADDALSQTAMQELGRVHIRPTYTRADGMVVNYSHAHEPISARGWCLQEYLMSPRALLFTSQTLQFRCHTSTQNIGDAVHEGGGERRLPDALFRPLDCDRPPVERGSKEWLDVRKAWQDIVEDYTRRTVGVASDKLVACSAVATAFQRVLHTDYLAGLWRDTLLIDLLWYKEKGDGLPRPAAFRAPSWSWAAVDGKVALGHSMWLSLRPSADSGPVAEVVRCEVTLEDSALPCGEVTDGFLMLHAALVWCRLHTEGGALRVRLQSAAHARRYGVVGTDDELVPEVELEAEKLGWAYIDSQADVGAKRLWAVPLLHEDGLLVGIIVTLVESDGSRSRTAEGERKVFRRVGFFDLSEEDGRGLGKALKDSELPLIDFELV